MDLMDDRWYDHTWVVVAVNVAFILTYLLGVLVAFVYLVAGLVILAAVTVSYITVLTVVTSSLARDAERYRNS